MGWGCHMLGVLGGFLSSDGTPSFPGAQLLLTSSVNANLEAEMDIFS